MNDKIINFFYPHSICVVGASSKEKSIGYEILKSIKNYGFTGSIFPVNPKGEPILGYHCHKSVLDIEEAIDLAIIVVPKQFVQDSIDQLIFKKAKSLILITAGFRETGEEGRKAEEAILSKLRSNDIRMVGPNCMGVINTIDTSRLNATFVAEEPKKGGIGFLSQSGALGAAVLNSLRETDIRFAHFISIGNKLDISELEIFKFWLTDDNIKTITMYLESFENGLEFLKVYESSDNGKPAIVLKAGRTESGMIAASSHTGALSSNEKITASLLNQFGIIRVNTINEMFNTAKGFEHFPLPKGDRIAIVTNAGGPGILAVDKLEDNELKLAVLSESTKLKLKEIVHPEGSINNPVDLLPGGNPSTFNSVNNILLKDENVDVIISIFVEPVMVNAFEVIESVNSLKSEKPIYQVCMPLPEFWPKYFNESNYKTPIFRNPEDPAIIISNILYYIRKKDMKKRITHEDSSTRFNVLEDGYITTNQVELLFNKYNLPVVNSIILNVDDDLGNETFSFPQVAKGLSRKAVHKSELNAVKLNIQNQHELKEAINEIGISFSENGLSLKQVLIQSQVDIKYELLIGGFRDESFGPVVVFGSGGKYVEVLNDTIIKSVYLNDGDIDEMISNTKIGKIIKGVRGEEGVDIGELHKIIKSVASIMIDYENIVEIDINPLIVDHELNFHAVDIRAKALK